VGVNIDVTPRVYANREVGMKIMLEVSAVTRYTNIGGIQQPVIGQRRVEHEIRLKEGEVNLLGGIMEQSDVRSVSGWPWVSQIPILKYLFSSESKETVDNEIVFALIPHIVRAQDVNDINTKALDVGTANAIDVRREPRAPEQAPVQQAPAQQQQRTVQPPMQQTPMQQTPTAPPQPPTAQSPTQQPMGGPPQTRVPAPQQTPPAPQQQALSPGGAILSFDPPTINPATGSTFMVNVSLAGGQNVYSVPLKIGYNPNTLQLVNVSNGNYLSRDGQAVALVHRDDPQTGSLQVSATRPPGSGGVGGDGVVFTLTFLAKAPGQSTLNIDRAVLRDGGMQSMPAQGSQAVVTVR